MLITKRTINPVVKFVSRYGFCMFVMFGVYTSALRAQIIGLAVDIGQTKTEPNDSRQTSQTGGTLGISVGSTFFLKEPFRSALVMMLGMQKFSLKGESTARRQELGVTIPFIDAAFHWIQGSGFEPGLMLRVYSGKNSSLRVEDHEKNVTAINIGLKSAYRFLGVASDVVIHASIMKDVNVSDQTNTQYLIGVQYWLMY